MHAVIRDKQRQLADICRVFGVSRLEVFGSAARGSDFDPARSDVDFLVQFEAAGLPALQRFFGLSQALEAELGRPVDLCSASAVENPYLQAAINRSKELVYAA